jgi:hypothetical protein
VRLERVSDGGLVRFAAGLESVASGGWKGPVQVATIGAVEELLHEQFANGIDPEGNPWTPTVRGNDPPLTQSGALAGSARAVPDGELDVLAQVTDEKAVWHQYGTKRGATSPGALPSDPERRGRGWKGRPDVRRKSHLTAERWHVPPRRILPIGDQPARWASRIQVRGQAVFTAFLRARLGV